MGLPEEEENVFDKLREKEIISEKVYQKLKEMKRFRNVLIHHHKKIENSKVYFNARNNSSDFREFKKEILSFLKKKS